MLKTKYLHRKSSKYYDHYNTAKYWRCKNIDLFSDLPFHQSIRNSHWSFNYSLTPLLKYLNSKIGENWNDVYSDILKKINKKYRFNIDRYLYSNIYYHGITLNPIYDDDYIPRNNYGKIIANRIYREGDVLVEKSKQEIISDAKKYQRKEKLNEIFENKDVEYVFAEFNEKSYNDYLILDGKMRMKKWKIN